MELYQEILCHVLANGKVQVSFPQLENTDVSKIVELECYQHCTELRPSWKMTL